MTRNLFSVPIFFIVFRETLEAAIIVASLLGLVKQIVYSHFHTLGSQEPISEEEGKKGSGDTAIFFGSALGFLIAVIIGAVFITIWFTKASDLYKKTEDIWEGIFQLIAAILIFVMGITMLKLNHAKTKWRIKLQHAFEGQHTTGGTKMGKWALFTLPFIVVLREGLEAVVFVGGVSLGQSASAIPIAAIVGIICGLICGFVIYTFASRAALTVFLVVMTNFILIIGAGLFSKSVGSFQHNAFNHLIGGDTDRAGDGPGTFDVRGNVWHLNCCNPDDKIDGGGWLIFGALTGWTNSATIGTVLSYVFYWLAAIVTLVALKWREGRLHVFGFESAAGKARLLRQAANKGVTHENESPLVNPTDEISELPK
ncbi:Ftr1 protein [Russula aff. rugulosa BPL654]|nr:Ftr1 protein [Russula aff. rugulosa BPL654]